MAQTSTSGSRSGRIVGAADTPVGSTSRTGCSVGGTVLTVAGSCTRDDKVSGEFLASANGAGVGATASESSIVTCDFGSNSATLESSEVGKRSGSAGASSESCMGGPARTANGVNGAQPEHESMTRVRSSEVAARPWAARICTSCMSGFTGARHTHESGGAPVAPVCLAVKKPPCCEIVTATLPQSGPATTSTCGSCEHMSHEAPCTDTVTAPTEPLPLRGGSGAPLPPASGSSPELA